jgi:hypothetical protein
VPAVISLVGLLAAILAARIVQMPGSRPPVGEPQAFATGNAPPDALPLPNDLPVAPSTVTTSATATPWVSITPSAGTVPAGTTTAAIPSPSTRSRPAPVPVPPSPATPPGPAPSRSTPPPATCLASYGFSSVWNGGFVASITFTNTSGGAWSGWSAGFGMSPAAGVTNSWNATLRASGGWVAVGPASYISSVPPGGQVQLGFQASTTATVNRLGPFSVNGQRCG